MRFSTFLFVLLISPIASALAASPVDPAMNGTWKLDWQGPAIFWALRDDGTYRLHGLGAKPQQHGAAEASDGRWSIKSPVWQDAGTYQLLGADTLQLTGALGTGIWKRVWTPSATAAIAPAGAPPICSLLSTQDVAKILRAPVFVDTANPRAAGGCIYKSQLGEFDQVSIVSHRVGPQDFQLRRRRTDGPPKADLPGLREGGYAQVDSSNLVGYMIRGAEELVIRVKLTPDATLADAPYLAEAARGIERRWASVAPPTRTGEAIPIPTPCCAVPSRAPAAPITNYRAPKLTDALTEQQYARAKRLHDNRRYDDALEAFMAPAERGDSRAQAMIGNTYYLRKPTVDDHRKALPWYERSARQGNRQAEFFLGEMYGEGDGVARDFKRSADYYEAAANMGLKEAQAAIGISYEFGYGVPRSRKTALLWLNRAARNGDGAGGWLADWLSRPDTPYLANESQLGTYISGKIGGFASQIGGGGSYSPSDGGSPDVPSSGGCSYSSAAACNAAKAGDLWAADRIGQRRSNPSEQSWYDH